MSVQNDVSFVFLSELYMIEHQSTINPNMPLRNLTYIAKVLSKITAKEDIYGSKQIKLPTPRFIVLYNGTKQTEEKTVLKLSDAYAKKTEEPELELITTVLNINEGYNEKLKSACKLLRDYMTLITKIREKQKTTDLQQATYQAIEECIREDVLKDLQESVDMALTAGIRKENIMLDPGIGFAKDLNQNLSLMKHLSRLQELGYPVLLGTSRKSMIGLTLDLPVDQREEGTLATSVLGLEAGCCVFRVHDVKTNLRGLKMTEAMLKAE